MQRPHAREEGTTAMRRPAGLAKGRHAYDVRKWRAYLIVLALATVLTAAQMVTEGLDASHWGLAYRR